MNVAQFTRRRFLSSIGAVSAFSAVSLAMPYYARGSNRPLFTSGVQSGDVDALTGVVWTRTDRPARLKLEYSTTESFAETVRLPTIEAGPDSDFAVKRLLKYLPPDQEIFYRFVAEDMQDVNLVSEPVTGRFRTAPAVRRDVRFAWSGDTAGQGWGIDETGMKTYSTIARHQPDFFIHSGDTIYADNPMPDEIRLRDGGTWRNVIVTDEKRDIAQTLDQFRGQWKYNLLDRHVRELHANCPVFHQWDDHEVLNNWSPSTDLSGDDRYKDKSVRSLSLKAGRAFHEMTPISYNPCEAGRLYRKVNYGPLLDVFFVDLRTYRGPNDHSLDPELSSQSRILGERQVAWLKQELLKSRAIWKVVACDLPVGLVIWDDYANRRGAEGIANGDDGNPLGRELEFADLLRFIRDNAIHNMVWLTADVHYTAAHRYDPARATFKDFLPFWEFVSGPLHSGTYGPKELDMTFGPEVRFIKASGGGVDSNLPPSAGLQFFGLVDIDCVSDQMTVQLMDRDDNELWRTTLDPARIS
ncbi:alkaline phosphatase D family protein [Rhizobiaceae bacterium n13]|uniref:Alkaline phosphatase D family protein n=1 Tax=Ferirhizobium litorale TaxID=2927786 RepID=A0AAE3QGS6_9HYPH|nr:alkaline phosphatase D family protein [Fererhizobium litorale]MDI7862443.1 alkaline phosphatase D family protein [Fererhizobium litorale]MDI7923670.1 alkaline phosphatase D family protein [Fererhizobium litorale]